MRTARLALKALVSTAIVVSCTGSSAENADFVLDEFTISGPTQIAAGVSTINAVNAGEFPHTLVVTTDQGVVVAATDLIDAGGSAALNVDIAPGSYQVTCRIVAQTENGDLVDHYEAGMHQLIDVKG